MYEGSVLRWVEQGGRGRERREGLPFKKLEPVGRSFVLFSERSIFSSKAFHRPLFCTGLKTFLFLFNCSKRSIFWCMISACASASKASSATRCSSNSTVSRWYLVERSSMEAIESVSCASSSSISLMLCGRISK